nr:DCC1-like thiol-disulfide oxidoreductase family protein [Thioclava nitratireducens]
MRRSATNTTSKATVFYDGACPLCRAEIGLYREAPGADALEFVDLSDPGATLPDALNRDDALARFHVRTRDGRLVSGAPRLQSSGRNFRAGVVWRASRDGRLSGLSSNWPTVSF